MGFFMVFFGDPMASNEGFQVDGEILQIRRVHILAVTDDALHLVVDRLARFSATFFCGKSMAKNESVKYDEV